MLHVRGVPRERTVIVYALVFCSTLLGQVDCRHAQPPMVFESLAECRQTGASLLRRPVGKDGRMVVGDAAWWQCAAKRVDAWELR